MAAVSLVVYSSWLNILDIGHTFSYFNDAEKNADNRYEAGLLDFSLEERKKSPLKINYSSTGVKTIKILNNGNLNFNYTAEGIDFKGQLCNFLEVRAKANGKEKYAGDLTDLNFGALFSESENLHFSFSFEGNETDYPGSSCSFYINFKGWREDAPDFSIPGFSDEEKVFIEVILKKPKLKPADLPQEDIAVISLDITDMPVIQEEIQENKNENLPQEEPSGSREDAVLEEPLPQEDQEEILFQEEPSASKEDPVIEEVFLQKDLETEEKEIIEGSPVEENAQ